MSGIPRLVVGGTSSGVGKTTIVVGLAGALQRRGMNVVCFKCGPDYLDPTYHRRVGSGSCQNLDGWMMGRDAVLSTFALGSEGADIALIEGVMGLFDGASPTDEAGSTAEIAKWLQAPVLLSIDASGMARTVAAVAHGLAHFDPDLQVAGLVTNRVGSRGHLDLLRKASREVPVLGGLPKQPEKTFPERHLGLRTASDQEAVGQELFDHWADLVEEWFDLDRLLERARAAGPLPVAEDSLPPAQVAARGRIGLAHDAAFHFYYPENLARLEALGAELVRFSPVRDSEVPEVDGLYLGGGYPETVAAQLSGNGTMLESMRAFAGRGGPIYAECGGLMYLSQGIRNLEGEFFPMVGLFEGRCQMLPKLAALGYVEVETQDRSILGGAGLRFRGHQFRYSELDPEPSDAERLYTLRRRRGNVRSLEGYRKGEVLASYIHAHWASNPNVAEGFVESCCRFQEQKS